MIAVSDAVLILVSATALGIGLYSWQGNVEQATLANARPAVSAEVAVQPSITGTSVQGATDARQLDNSSSQNNADTASQVPGSSNTPVTDTQTAGQSQTQTQTGVVVIEQSSTASINVADDIDTTANNQAVVDVPPYGSYIVQSGDSLSQISLRYGTSVGALQEINQLDGTLITVGQELRYPVPAN